jgi:hypothetical protein
MPRKLIKRWLPDNSRLHEHPHLRRLGHRLLAPDLWHLNRRSASGGVAMGLAVAFVPVPMQMVVAAVVAMVVRVNLPLAVAMVWVTNPLTIPPLYWLAYEAGAWLLARPRLHAAAMPGLSWFVDMFGQIWQPLLLGLVILGAASGSLGYLAVRLLWRLQVVRAWEERRRRRASAGAPSGY